MQAFSRAVADSGRIDYVFPIAGIGERVFVPASQPGSFEKPDLGVLEVDLVGVVYTIALAVQQMRRQERERDEDGDVKGEGKGWRGKIVCVASVCGFYAVPTLPLYTAAKQ